MYKVAMAFSLVMQLKVNSETLDVLMVVEVRVLSGSDPIRRPNPKQYITVTSLVQPWCAFSLGPSLQAASHVDKVKAFSRAFDALPLLPDQPTLPTSLRHAARQALWTFAMSLQQALYWALLF